MNNFFLVATVFVSLSNTLTALELNNTSNCDDVFLSSESDSDDKKSTIQRLMSQRRTQPRAQKEIKPPTENELRYLKVRNCCCATCCVGSTILCTKECGLAGFFCSISTFWCIKFQDDLNNFLKENKSKKYHE